MLGELIKQARNIKGITRSEFAELIDSNVNSISKYEKAGSELGQLPPANKLAKIALVLEIDPRILLASLLDDEEQRNDLIYFGVPANLKEMAVAAIRTKDRAKEIHDTILKGKEPIPQETVVFEDNYTDKKIEELISLTRQQQKTIEENQLQILEISEKIENLNTKENGLNPEDQDRNQISNNNPKAVDAAPTNQTDKE